MTVIMECLRQHLTAEDFDKLTKVAQAMDGPPFRYSLKRREFSPSDGWFLLEMDDCGGFEDCCPDDAADAADDAVTAGNADTAEDLMDLAMRCCDILNAKACEVDTMESVEEEPRLRKYSATYDIEDDALSESFVKALTESGYEPSVVRNGADSVSITVPFTASTEWEHTNETDNIETIYSMVRAHIMGRNPKATRL